MDISYINGYMVYYDPKIDEFRYIDNNKVVDHNDLRYCPRCGRKPTKEGHDACLGRLPGVKAACCGHGTTEGYIWFENGICVRFKDLKVEE